MESKTTPDGWKYHYSPPNPSEKNLAKRILTNFKLTKENLVMNDRTQINPFELDIWIPSLNMAFEFQGPEHYKQKNRHTVKITDLMKKKICKKRRIKLVQLPYFNCSDTQIIKKAGSYKLLEKTKNMTEEWDQNLRRVEKPKKSSKSKKKRNQLRGQKAMKAFRDAHLSKYDWHMG